MVESAAEMRVRKRSEASVIRDQLLVLGRRPWPDDVTTDNGTMGIADRERSYCTSLPIATCPGRRNVFTKSASPQTIIPGNRLNHFPFGTSGRVEPIGKQTDLARRDFAGSDAIKQVVQQSRRKTSPANFRHRNGGRRIHEQSIREPARPPRHLSC